MDASDYIISKLTAGVGGLFGGFGLMTYIKPTSVTESFARGGVSTGAACIFASPLLVFAGVKPDWDMEIASGALIGFTAYFILGAVANFFRRNEKRDIIEVVHSVTKKRGKKDA